MFNRVLRSIDPKLKTRDFNFGLVTAGATPPEKCSEHCLDAQTGIARQATKGNVRGWIVTWGEYDAVDNINCAEHHQNAQFSTCCSVGASPTNGLDHGFARSNLTRYISLLLQLDGDRYAVTVVLI